MVQHVLLLAVVPPLLAAACRSRSGCTRSRPGGAARCSRRWRAVLRSQENHYWLAWTAFALAARDARVRRGTCPPLYDAAVRNAGVHVLEHVSFVATATLFWWMVLGAGRRERRGLGVLGVFIATLPATALGLLMTLAATSWYSRLRRTAPPRCANQQIAGAVMWGFGGLALGGRGRRAVRGLARGDGPRRREPRARRAPRPSPASVVEPS